jgi:hypothetical protein
MPLGPPLLSHHHLGITYLLSEHGATGALMMVVGGGNEWAEACKYGSLRLPLGEKEADLPQGVRCR